MRPLLIILNPRAIPECVDAFRALDIDKAWMTGFRERELIEPIAQVIADTDYTHYVAVSDDVIVTQTALNHVLALLHRSDFPVATGWCNLDGVEGRVNLTKTPLQGREPTLRSYDFYHWAEVLAHPADVLPTFFTGMCLTGMSRELWQRFPFDCYGDLGAASDFHLSLRLHDAGIPIVAAKRGFVYHVKDNWPSADISDPAKALVHVANGVQRVTLERNGWSDGIPSESLGQAIGENPMPAPGQIRPMPDSVMNWENAEGTASLPPETAEPQITAREALLADAQWGD